MRSLALTLAYVSLPALLSVSCSGKHSGHKSPQSAPDQQIVEPETIPELTQAESSSGSSNSSSEVVEAIDNKPVVETTDDAGKIPEETAVEQTLSLKGYDKDGTIIACVQAQSTKETPDTDLHTKAFLSTKVQTVGQWEAGACPVVLSEAEDTIVAALGRCSVPTTERLQDSSLSDDISAYISYQTLVLHRVGKKAQQVKALNSSVLKQDAAGCQSLGTKAAVYELNADVLAKLIDDDLIDTSVLD
jgi:hypothetical protein